MGKCLVSAFWTNWFCPDQSTLKLWANILSLLNCSLGLTAEWQKRDYCFDMNYKRTLAVCVCIGAECKMLQQRWRDALGFEWVDPCTGHSYQIHRLAGHLHEDSAGGLLSPWKHWLDQGCFGANYRTLSLGGPIYWKTVRGATASVHWAQRVTYSMHHIAGCAMNDLNWGTATREHEFVENLATF